MVFPELSEVRSAVYLEDRDKDFVLRAEMPGFKKDDIEIKCSRKRCRNLRHFRMEI